MYKVILSMNQKITQLEFIMFYKLVRTVAEFELKRHRENQEL